MLISIIVDIVRCHGGRDAALVRTYYVIRHELLRTGERAFGAVRLRQGLSRLRRPGSLNDPSSQCSCFRGILLECVSARVFVLRRTRLLIGYPARCTS